MYIYALMHEDIVYKTSTIYNNIHRFLVVGYSVKGIKHINYSSSCLNISAVPAES